MHRSFFRLSWQYSGCTTLIMLNYCFKYRRQSFSNRLWNKVGWTEAIAMISWGVNRSAIICMFFSLSIYLWLLSDFFLEKLFFLVKKVGLVCGRGLSVLYYENLCPNALFSLSGFIFICFYFYLYYFYFYWYVCEVLFLLLRRQYSRSHISCSFIWSISKYCIYSV